MNIDEYKSSYDGVHATGSLKKRVLEQAERIDAKAAKKKKSPLRKALTVGSGLAGAAAAITLTVVGIGYFGSQGDAFPTSQKERGLSDYTAYSPAKGCIGELRSYVDTGDPRTWEAMPDPSGTDLSLYGDPFIERFTVIPEELESCAGEEFAAWKEGFLTFTRSLPYCTFYDSMNLLSFVKQFDVPQDKAIKLLTGKNGLSGEEVSAIAMRDEKACLRLFVRDDVPLVKTNDDGLCFYTLEDLYKIAPYELFTLLEHEDNKFVPIEALERWAESVGDDTVRAAVLRKTLIVRSYITRIARPRLADDSPLSGYYEQRVCDFNETITINGCSIGNYVLYLLKMKVSDPYVLETAINGAASEPGVKTITSYGRLVSNKIFNISSDELREALQLINRHYFGQTGEFLYTDEELDIICGGDDDLFAERFRLPTVLCSDLNPIGGTLWINGKRLYESGAAGWLEYGDLTEELLNEVLGVLRDEEGAAAVTYFKDQMKMWQRVRILTAAYLDGGTLAADDGLLGEAPEFSGDILEAFSGSEAVSINTPFGTSGSVKRDRFLSAPLRELAGIGYSPAGLEKDIRGVIERFDPDMTTQIYLLKKLYLYRRNIDYANLYNDEYMRIFLNSNRAITTDGQSAVIVPAPDDRELAELKKHHITNIYSSMAEYTGQYGENEDVPEIEGMWVEELPEGEGKIISADEEAYGEVYPGTAEAVPDTGAQIESTAKDISEYMLKVGVNPILPEAGERGRFFCAGYGYDKWLDKERAGMDLAAGYNDNVAALEDGKVSYSGDFGNSGLRIVIDHEGGMQTEYALCARLLVKEGDRVRKGDIIAQVGDTGKSTGPHLHFAVIVNGVNVDPAPYLEK